MWDPHHRAIKIQSTEWDNACNLSLLRPPSVLSTAAASSVIVTMCTTCPVTPAPCTTVHSYAQEQHWQKTKIKRSLVPESVLNLVLHLNTNIAG